MRLSTFAVTTSALLLATMLTPATAVDMTFERGLNVQSEPQNWVLHHGNYQGHRFSALNEINTETAKNLKVAFTVGLGGIEGAGTRYKFGNLEATPLVEDGIMYVPDGWGSVYAIDMTSGKKGMFRWKFDPATDKAWAGDVACCGVNNRGVALWKDKVISISLDGRLFAINKATGEKVWERIADPAIGETLTLAPLVIRDVAIVGTAGGEYGIRGFIEGTDLNTGQALWRTYTIPGAGEPATTPGRTARTAGSTVAPRCGRPQLMTPTPTPSTRASAMPARTGTRNIARATTNGRQACSRSAERRQDQVGFQYTPNDPYDYDEISEHPIINAKVNGEDRKLVVHAARNGFFYALDRVNGAFVAGKQYVDELNWTTGLDPKTGRPLNYDPTKDVQEYNAGSHGTRAKPVGNRLCPAVSGGKNWQPSAYNPQLGLLFIPSIEGCNFIETAEQKDFADQGGPVKPRDRFVGGGPKTTNRLFGSIKAVDPTTGETKAKLKLDFGIYSGLLATAGNLVFLGQMDGTFAAYDARTLNEVWSFNVGSGINAPPVTFSINRKQYVAVLVGSRQPANIINN